MSYSSTGVGTSLHLSGFMLFKAVGVEALHVPYQGADVLNDLLAGRNQAMFATIPSGSRIPRPASARPLRYRALPGLQE